MSGYMISISVTATIADSQEWTEEHLAAAHLAIDAAETAGDRDGPTTYDDWVYTELQAVMLRAAIDYAAAHPDMFMTEPS